MKELPTELLFTSFNYTDFFFITKLMVLGKLSASPLPRYVMGRGIRRISVIFCQTMVYEYIVNEINFDSLHH